jgi:malate synthase
VIEVLAALAPHNVHRRELLAARSARRLARARNREPLAFLDPAATVPGTRMSVAEARAGRFEGSEIPPDLARQWIQGTGPATKPRASVASGIRNVAYALLSGADGWMFDGEDALGQVATMSLDGQRNLKLAIHGDPIFLAAAERVAEEMNAWSVGFFGEPKIRDWRSQLGFTTKLFRPRGLHLDDRHVREVGGPGFAASIVDVALYVAHNHRQLREAGSTVALYLPKIETAEDAALWHAMLSELEAVLGMPSCSIKVYVLVERVEACFQLMEIRAALAPRFVGFNTGRWDYINSVSDAMSWDPGFVNPNIDAVVMTWGYMRHYEDRVRRAVNTPDRNGRTALWQGGMEPNIPVGSAEGVAASMRRAVAGAEREEREGASGKWVAHWKMVHIVRPVWERAGRANQLGRPFPPLEYGPEEAALLTRVEPAPRTVRGARDLLSVALQYGNAFEQGYQAAALKPADFFGDDGVLYLMEDMATGEIRLSILWEWLAKRARFTEDDPASGVRAGETFTPALFARLLEEEYGKLLRASDRDVHDDSKETTLPIAREIVAAYVREEQKPPWYIDLLNLNLDHHDRAKARERIAAYLERLRVKHARISENVDFDVPIGAEP